MPPYSSMTIARWIRRCCISLSSSSTGLLSGTNVAGRMTDSTFSTDSRSGCSWLSVHQVLEVGDADHVVLVLADHRDPGEPAAQRQRQRLAEGLVALHEDHVGARDHDLADDRVAELEHRVDHGPLAGLDDLALLQQVHQAAQLLLGAERASRDGPARA